MLAADQQLILPNSASESCEALSNTPPVAPRRSTALRGAFFVRAPGAREGAFKSCWAPDERLKALKH
eukprot:15432641-Alexandrium_andersonii.AAC.1